MVSMDKQSEASQLTFASCPHCDRKPQIISLSFTRVFLCACGTIYCRPQDHAAAEEEIAALAA